MKKFKKKLGGEYRNRTDESEFCRLVPYRLANSPKIIITINSYQILKSGAGNENRTRD